MPEASVRTLLAVFAGGLAMLIAVGSTSHEARGQAVRKRRTPDMVQAQGVGGNSKFPGQYLSPCRRCKVEMAVCGVSLFDLLS